MWGCGSNWRVEQRRALTTESTEEHRGKSLWASVTPECYFGLGLAALLACLAMIMSLILS
jgi:hypothetical protein